MGRRRRTDTISSSGTIYLAEEGGKNIENIVTVRRNDNNTASETPRTGFVTMSVEVEVEVAPDS